MPPGSRPAVTVHPSCMFRCGPSTSLQQKRERDSHHTATYSAGDVQWSRGEKRAQSRGAMRHERMPLRCTASKVPTADDPCAFLQKCGKKAYESHKCSHPRCYDAECLEWGCWRREARWRACMQRQKSVIGGVSLRFLRLVCFSP